MSEGLTRAQEVYLKLRKHYPEDPDSIRAKAELKKREDDKFRQLLLKRRRDNATNAANLEKAREVRAANLKPKTKEGSK